MLLLSVTHADPLTLADAFKSPSTIVFVLLAIGLVALFLKVQSLSMQVDALKKQRRDVSGPSGSPVRSEPVPAPADAELVAILTAAAVACLGRRVVVRRITFLNQNTVSGWAEAGRLSIHTSHNVRRN